MGIKSDIGDSRNFKKTYWCYGSRVGYSDYVIIDYMSCVSLKGLTE